MYFALNKKLVQIITVFILGFLLGSMITNIVFGYRIDRYVLQVEDLEQKLENTENELEDLKKSLAKEKEQVITSINPLVTITETGSLSKYQEDAARLALEKELSELLVPFRGQNIDKINPYLILPIINDRQLEVESQFFNLKVKIIIITEEKLTIEVEAQLTKELDKAMF